MNFRCRLLDEVIPQPAGPGLRNISFHRYWIPFELLSARGESSGWLQVQINTRLLRGVDWERLGREEQGRRVRAETRLELERHGWPSDERLALTRRPQPADKDLDTVFAVRVPRVWHRVAH